jgi:uncharacterized protein with von Willebrand factor type A (vWA) domain
MSDEQTAEDTWREVGDQFKALGESLATAFRTAWESEENRRHLESMKEGLEAMVDQVGQAVKETSASPEAHRVRTEVERAAESARAAGEKALQDARPHLISALGTINDELQKLIRRMEQGERAPEETGGE